ncbi:hypothetical protein VB716_00830 [Synechococcus sp. CCY9201]|uniref:hypothetical protein n=1 Tax=Synechococcus sp. CCY9201 TaxID=174697 RepID=UPI002B1F4F49|nr:hypothetical protein [Synechococcus sp. CCY9201]MEA5472766.1 hypothetical protein [Synechococcus sp. CCY9201]
MNVLTGGQGGGPIYAIGVDFLNTAVDIIADWDATAGTNVIANNTNLFDATTPLQELDGGWGVLTTDLSIGQNYAIRGSCNADLGNFTFNPFGSDVLIGVTQGLPPFDPGADGFTDKLVVLTDVNLTTTFSQANFI